VQWPWLRECNTANPAFAKISTTEIAVNKYHLWVIALLAITLTGCGKLMELRNDAPADRVVAIDLFKCNCDPLTQESVRDSFLDVFYKTTNATPIEGNTGDIVLTGTITTSEGSSARASGFSGNASSSAANTYVSGITVRAYKGGLLIATHSVGQDLGGGVLLSPITFGATAARYISTILVRQNEIGRR